MYYPIPLILLTHQGEGKCRAVGLMPYNYYYYCVRSTRLLIHFKELKFQLFELQEPLFCTAALYDTATRTRISESFHFDYNGQLELGTPCATIVANKGVHLDLLTR